MKAIIITIATILLFSIQSNAQTEIDTTTLLTVESLKALQAEINSYSLSANVGYKHDRSNTKEYVERSGELRADYSLYPFEFNASFGFKNTLSDNETQQNLNALDISIDRYLRHVHNRQSPKGMVFRPEMFMFFQRTTNEYLALRQKYETGAGLTLNLFSSVTIDKETDLFNRVATVQQHYSTADKDTRAMLDNIYTNHNAKYRKFRVALLFGILSQTEEYEHTTTIDLNGTDSTVSITYEPIQEYKWEVRPTISYRPFTDIKIDARAYVKVPFTEMEKNIDGKTELDYFIYAPLRFSYNPGILSFAITYSWYYDNARHIEYFETSAGSKSVYLPNEYSSLDFTVGINFN